MDPTIKEIIRTQCQEQDDLTIERVFHECNGDVVKTLLKLANAPEEQEKPKTIFDEIRTICDDKDTVLQEKLAQSKNI